jgi:hypothetical protein
MSERPCSQYTREKTWKALYSQHINAGYAWVPFSATNNSIDLIRCDSPGEARRSTQELLKQADACATYYEAERELAMLENQALTKNMRTEHEQKALMDRVCKARDRRDKACPNTLSEAGKTGRLRTGAVLARSHDYYRYSLYDHPQIKLVICGLHDSYLALPVWEMRTNRRYKTHETALSITAPDFDRIRRTQTGHHILLAAYAHGDPDAVAFVEREDFPERTRRRLKREKEALQEAHYRGRPMAFLTEAERQAIGGKISEGLKRYHAGRRGGAV